MAKNTQDNSKAPAAPAAPKEPSTELTLTMPSPKAMAATIGPKVLEMWDASDKDMAQAENFIDKGTKKMRLATSMITEAIYNMFRVDHRLVELCEVLIKDDSDDARKRKSLSLDTLRIGLGTHVLVQVGEIPSAVVAPAAQKYFPTGKEKDGSPEKARKMSRLKNWGTEIKTAAINALSLYDMDATVSLNADKGVLLIEGPKVLETMGVESVLLDERKDPEALKAEGFRSDIRPSLASIRDIAKKARGVVGATPKVVSKTAAIVEGDVQKTMQSLCPVFITALNRLENTANVDTQRQLQAVYNAIAAVLAPIVDKNGKRKA